MLTSQDADWLVSPAGLDAIGLAAQARSRHPGQATAAANALQGLGGPLTAVQRSLALAQAELYDLANLRYGIDAAGLLLTRDGLEQATRPEISAERVRNLGLETGTPIVDATAGLGFDAGALVAAGLQVTAVERDPGVAELLRHNVSGARIIVGDITDPAVLGQATAGTDRPSVFYLDPARRSGIRSVDGGRAQPERDPQRWSPPWSYVLDLARRFRVCVKVNPGFPPDRVPIGWRAAWLGTRHGPAEAFLCSWPALPTARRACQVRGGGVNPDDVDLVDDDEEGSATTMPLDAYLHEPAQVVGLAHLVDALARGRELNRLSRTTHWLTSTGPLAQAQAGGLLTSYRVVDELPTSPKAMRAALRARGIGDLTIKSRGSRVDATTWRARLRMPEGPSAIVAIWDAQGSPRACLVDRCP